eukprot:CAMPEP_0185309214 /NCGR_PEP_ID=MMETSP1363-20130426/22319_1 /TAXON_ID=38817 /ORGANISM="Gephyrocapsa oceanica, Strain RCC1303" /LENGTH=148 /DNA_ID=CAMNT_0027906705 /DNA_START=278 /DNA_END=727 /DNA_ORIENTATION=-
MAAEAPGALASAARPALVAAAEGEIGPIGSSSSSSSPSPPSWPRLLRPRLTAARPSALIASCPAAMVQILAGGVISAALALLALAAAAVRLAVATASLGGDGVPLSATVLVNGVDLERAMGMRVVERVAARGCRLHPSMQLILRDLHI